MASRVFVPWSWHMLSPPLVLPCPYRRRTGVEVDVGEGGASSLMERCVVSCRGGDHIAGEGVGLAMVTVVLLDGNFLSIFLTPSFGEEKINLRNILAGGHGDLDYCKPAKCLCWTFGSHGLQ